jgi:hypothetical protein
MAGGARRSTRWGIVAVLLLVACAGGGPTTTPTLRNRDSWSFAQGIMDRGPMLIDVRGKPFATDQAVIGDTVARAMEQAITWSAGARFTANAQEAASPTFRVVTTFNGPVGLGSVENCRGGGEGGAPLPDNQARMLMTLCDGADVISNVQGSVGPMTGVADPQFTNLIRQATRDLFPRENFRDRGMGIGVGIGGGGGGVGWGVGF